MLKKVLLMIAVMIFAFSCSKTPTDPNGSGTGNTGDGGIIDGGSGTTSPEAISDFLKKHSGRYYDEYESGNIIMKDIMLRIENGKMYDGKDKYEMDNSKSKITLSGNKLQMEVTGNDSQQQNSSIVVFNFVNNGIQMFPKPIYQKENFQVPADFVEIAKINGAEKYTGAYYMWSQETSDSPIVKSYSLAIDASGTIYVNKNMKEAGATFELNGNILSYTMQVENENITIKYDLIMEQNRAINDGVYENGKQHFYEYKKSDLLSTYIGIYTGEGITLTVDEADAVMNPEILNHTSILNGNVLTIYEVRYETSTTMKEHKIVFNSDGTAAYTKPDGAGTVTLQK